MNGQWSDWVPVAHWLDTGWNEPAVPWAKGVYRFRVKPGHPERGGDVVYVGRGGAHADKDTSTICTRVASFITAGMGFWSGHSGGVRFFNYWEPGAEAPKHSLCVRDLEVSWATDDDPMCREAEELARLPALPLGNAQWARTCRRDGCARAYALWENHQMW
jgi:hypothetical protein